MAERVLGKDHTDDASPSSTWYTTLWSGVANLDVLMSNVYKALGSNSAARGKHLEGNGAWSYASGLPCEGRLTLTTAVAVTTADVTGATTMYFTPYKGSRLALYDGTTGWDVLAFSEISLALGTLTSGLPYDVFVYNSSGTPTLEFTAWSTGTARVTALVLQDGVYVKTGALTRRYLGTFVTTSTTATEDSIARRYVYNYYNRVVRKLKAFDATNSWAWVTAAFQEARAGSTLGTSRVGFVIGVAEDVVTASSISVATVSSGTIVMSAGIGLDSATNVSDINGPIVVGSANQVPSLAMYRAVVAVGLHYLAWLEYGGANATFYGDNGASVFQTGLVAEVMA